MSSFFSCDRLKTAVLDHTVDLISYNVYKSTDENQMHVRYIYFSFNIANNLNIYIFEAQQNTLNKI